jgi:hypothetical protein
MDVVIALIAGAFFGAGFSYSFTKQSLKPDITTDLAVALKALPEKLYAQLPKAIRDQIAGRYPFL